MKRKDIQLLLLTLLVIVILVGTGLTICSLGGFQIPLEFIKVWATAVFILLIGFDIFIVWDSRF